MINKKSITKLIFSSLSKCLIVVLVIVGYLLINKMTTYAAAYPDKNTGLCFLYFTDADGTEYGYKIDIKGGGNCEETNQSDIFFDQLSVCFFHARRSD